MPVSKKYKTWKGAAKAVKKANPSYSKQQVNAVVATIEKRHKAKQRRKKK